MAAAAADRPGAGQARLQALPGALCGAPLQVCALPIAVQNASGPRPRMQLTLAPGSGSQRRFWTPDMDKCTTIPQHRLSCMRVTTELCSVRNRLTLGTASGCRAGVCSRRRTRAARALQLRPRPSCATGWAPASSRGASPTSSSSSWCRSVRLPLFHTGAGTAPCSCGES